MNIPTSSGLPKAASLNTDNAFSTTNKQTCSSCLQHSNVTLIFVSPAGFKCPPGSRTFRLSPAGSAVLVDVPFLTVGFREGGRYSSPGGHLRYRYLLTLIISLCIVHRRVFERRMATSQRCVLNLVSETHIQPGHH